MLTTNEVLAAAGINRPRFDYLRDLNPKLLQPIRIIGMSLMWDPATVELVKKLRSKIRTYRMPKTRKAKAGEVLGA